MESHIDQIRSLLNLIEDKITVHEAAERPMDSFNYLDLPDIVLSIVEFLQPLLLPYELGIYWYMFANSIVRHGTDTLRVSTRGLGSPETVMKSSSGQSDSLSYGAVQTALKGLETKGAIRRVGDTTREGTPYRVLLPEEIEIAQLLMQRKSGNDGVPLDEERELDFYNVKENRYKVFERDGYRCRYCGKQLTRYSATLDHVQPVSKGGDNAYDNLVTACLQCNSQRTNHDVMDAIIRGEETA